MKISLKSDRTSWKEILKLLHSISIAVILAVVLTDCDKKEDTPTPTPTPTQTTTPPAHGEKSLTNFMRMRTIHWFNLNWSKEEVPVNDTMNISGKFLIFSGWPETVDKPEISFLNIGIPGPVFIRLGSWIEGQLVPGLVSFELGETFGFKSITETGKTAEKVSPLPETKKVDLQDYSVTVSANEKLEFPGPPGELRVWIGVSSNAPRVQSDMTTETKSLEAVGETAKVTPFTLGIDVDPKVSVCEKIDPSGSEVRFKLTPSKPGTFTVGADVELYESRDCSGPPVPKSAKSVKVEVSVNTFAYITNDLAEFVKATWKAFLAFWDKLLLLFSGYVLWRLQKKLPKRNKP